MQRVRDLYHTALAIKDPKERDALLRGNPMVQSILSFAKQNGGDLKAVFYSLAKQRGVDPESILSQLK